VPNNALSHAPPDDVNGVEFNVRVLALVLVRVILNGTWVPEPAKVADAGLAVRTLLMPPPPPPLLEPLNVTVIVTGGTPAGELGVRVTVAEAPGFTPDVLPMAKCRLVGVVVPPDTVSHPVREPVVSPE